MNSPKDADRISEIKRRLAKTTPGDWKSDDRANPYDPDIPFSEEGASICSTALNEHGHNLMVVQGGQQDGQGGVVGVASNDDANFIAHSKKDIEWLIKKFEDSKLHENR